MAVTSVSDQSKQIADEAITAGVIGMLAMAAETGTPLIFRVRYRTESGMLTTSPYALFADEDEQRLVVFTAQADKQTLAIPKRAIVRITLAQPAEVVRSLNAARPVASLTPPWYASMVYLRESYRQWDRMVWAFRRMAR